MACEISMKTWLSSEIASKVGLINDGTLIIEDEPNKLRKRSGLDQSVVSIETSIMNEHVYRTIKTVVNDGNLLETRTGYRFFCEQPEDIINKVARKLGMLGCKTTHIEKTIPSLEDIFFKLTEKKMVGW